MATLAFSSYLKLLFQNISLGWSGGAMVLGKLPVPGRPTILNDSRARTYCACSRCGWGVRTFFSSPGRSPGRAIVLPLGLALAWVSPLAKC